MRAIVITEPGDPAVLAVREVPDPVPGHAQVRVRVEATALNRADLLQRRGHYPAPSGAPEDIPGLEYAGMIDAVGPGVVRRRPGERVMGLVGGGAYAELLVTHERESVEIPAALDTEAAAAVPEAFITAHDALFTRLGLASGERLLIHAVGSGVGTAALQLAKAAGATVFGTSRSGWKLDRARQLGLDVAIDSSVEEFAAVVAERTGGEGVHAVLDLVGGPYLGPNLDALAVLGRMVHVGTVAGTRAELDLRKVLSKRLTLVGTVLRARPLEQKIDAARRFETHVVPLLANGRVRPIVDRVLPVTEAVAAHQAMEGDETFGKIVLRW